MAYAEDVITELMFEIQDLKAERRDDKAEIYRHHEHFEKISEILDEFFCNPLYINSYYALESLKKIRNIVG